MPRGMRLKRALRCHFGTACAAIGNALALVNQGRQVWVIKSEKPYRYLVYVEDELGSLPVPAVVVQVGVLTEADRFTDPKIRVNLGPGVWPDLE